MLLLSFGGIYMMNKCFNLLFETHKGLFFVIAFILAWVLVWWWQIIWSAMNKKKVEDEVNDG